MNQNQKRIALGSVSAIAVIGIGTALFLGLGHKKNETWVRQQAAHIEYTTRSGDDLNKVAIAHGGVPTLMLAVFNDGRLRTGFEQHCGDDRVWPRPGRYYCNPRLNLARASTLKPQENLRIPDSTALPRDIERAVDQMGARESVAILVDATNPYLKQRGLDAAVEWNLALSKQGRPLATIWIFNNQGMVEYRNDSSLWVFGAKHTPFQNAMRMLDTQAISRVVLVTNARMTEQDMAGAAIATPITGYCLTSACQTGMEQLTKTASTQLGQKGASFAVPHTS